MIIASENITNMINAPVRNIVARVELYSGSDLLDTFKYNDRLIGFTIERVGQGKFFGYGISHRLNVRLMDKDRELNITTAHTLEAVFGSGSDYIYTFPLFHVTEVNRDEITNELSITAYCPLNAALTHFYSDLVLEGQYNIKTLVTACGAVLGLPMNLEQITDNSFDTTYTEGANFEGTETVKEVLDTIAEATQTIYYINSNWELTFKRLGGSEAYSIDKARYFELESGNNRRLSAITHVTELEDNVTAALDTNGTTQYVRNNPFWDFREDIADLLNAALERVGGLTINQFRCSWRGNFLLEIGDKLALTTKDGTVVYSYLLDDVLEYNGALSQTTQWNYEDADNDTESNPTNLGDAIKQTYAKVDKANKQIELVVSQVEDTNKNVSDLSLTTDDITLSVQEISTTVAEGLEAVNNELSNLSQQAQLAVTKEDVNIAITTELSNGVDKVTTATGYVFNEDGLTISKSDSEISTQITENGMQVSKAEDVVLTANNEGVQAEDLHATTYLIIGTNSRFEDYIDISGENRTGCFWIGG